VRTPGNVKGVCIDSTYLIRFFGFGFGWLEIKIEKLEKMQEMPLLLKLSE
jgi:hypothetical protein